jgi:hypothetical protein
MQLSAVILARVLAYIETADLDARGAVFFPELIRKLVHKFEFQKFPTTFEATDEDKGVDFLEGRWDGVTVDKLTIFRGALVLDTSASTSHSERIVEEALAWASTECGLSYKPGMIVRKQYLSNVMFYSKIRLVDAHTAILKLQKGISKSVSIAFGQPLSYDITHLGFDFDKTKTPLVTAAFSIQRRGNALFSENKYYSEAPLQTDVHLKLLEQFEADLTPQ